MSLSRDQIGVYVDRNDSAEDIAKLRKSVLSLIRSCLLPLKRGISVDKLFGLYKSQVGEGIPYKRLGYQNLDDFLISAFDVCRIERDPSTGEWIIKGKADAATAHVADLVKKQRDTKRKSKPVRPVRRPMTQLGSWAPPSRDSPPGSRGGSGRFLGGGGGNPFPGGRHQPYRGGGVGVGGGGGRYQQGGRGGFVGGGSSAQARLRAFQSGGSGGVNNANLRAPAAQIVWTNHTGVDLPSIGRSHVRQAAVGGGGPAQAPVNGRLMNGGANRLGNGRAQKTVDTFNTSPPQQQQRGGAGNQMSRNTNSSGGYVRSLRDYYEKNGLGPLEFKTANLENKKMRRTTYISTIYLNGKSYQTFPQEYSTEDQAEEAVAKKVLESLGIQDKGSNAASTATAPKTDSKTSATNGESGGGGVKSPACDMTSVAERVLSIVGSRTNGVWSTQVEVEYKRKYGESPPDDWVAKLEAASNRLRVDSPIERRFIIFPNLNPVAAAAPAQPEAAAASAPKPAAATNGIAAAAVKASGSLNGSAAAAKSNADAAIGTAQAHRAVAAAPPNPKHQKRPPPITHPADDYWEVYITYVHSTAHVCLRLLGDDYSNKFDDLSTNMELHFYDMENIPMVRDPQVGHIYAAKLDTDWHRVEVLNVHGIDIRCYFIDHGDEDVVKIEDLRYIDEAFLELPAQAIAVKLQGLEGYAENDSALSHVNNLVLGKSLVGEVSTTHQRASRENGDVVMVLFDTSGKEDINVNEKLIQLLHSEECGKLPPVGGEKTTVFVSFVSASGDLFVQKENETYSMIEKLISDCTDLALNKQPPPRANALNNQKLYLAKYHLDDRLYRAALLETRPRDGKVAVYFVDFGNNEEIKLEDLREIQMVSALLAQMPHQALKCRLAGVPPSSSSSTWTSAASSKLRELVPDDKRVLLKVVNDKAVPPEVELLERMAADAAPISINKALIACQKELFVGLESGPASLGSCGSSARASPLPPPPPSVTSPQPPMATMQQQGDAALNAALSPSPQVPQQVEQANAFLGALPPPSPQPPPQPTFVSPHVELMRLASLKPLVPASIPEVSEFFDVNVTLAANPGNFTVQPWKHGAELEKHQDDMNVFYGGLSPDHRAHLTIDDVRPNMDRYFVAQHTDGMWYRVRVDNTLDSYTVAVKFVDFGDFSMVGIQDLQPLHPTFRNLPMQAVKAGLADIIPVNGDWTPDDTVWFNQRVVDKQFVSVIKDVSYDEDDGTLRLSLSLIDTTTQDDIFVEKELVDLGKAVYLCL